MLQNYQSGQPAWAGMNHLLNKWLIERQELIRLYCSLTDDDADIPMFLRRLGTFCEVLVDYLSAGHFEVFTQLENEARHLDERGLKLVNALYPYLEQSTEIALCFNDRCEQLKQSHREFEKIREELSYLGESLTDRFQLEDQLIEYVHKDYVHSQIGSQGFSG
jgi:regulator of sigma D